MESQGLESEQANLEEQIAILRKQYDDMRHLSLAKERDVEVLEDKLKDLERDCIRPNGEDLPLTRQIRTLQNKLDKAMIKYNEAQSIRKTYEQIVKRLKDERVGFDNQLQAIERTLKAKEHDLEELMLMSHDASHAKEIAKADLAKLEGQIAEERKQREKELAEKRAIVQAKKEMAARLERREKIRRDVENEASGDLDGQSQAALDKSGATNASHHVMTEQRLQEEAERITAYEDAYRKIQEATGVVDVKDVIQKFLSQEDAHKNLVQMTEEARSRIEALSGEKNQLKSKVEEVKYSGGASIGGRTVVGQFEGQATTSNAKFDRNKQQYERMAKILINVKAGVSHLVDKLEEVPFDEPILAVTDKTLVDVLKQCRQKLMALSTSSSHDVSAQSESEPARKSSPEVRIEGVEGEGQLSALNVRVKLRDKNEEQMSDDENDDDAEEDVPDRETMKRLAGMMMEKATKKTRRRRRGGSSNSDAGMMSTTHRSSFTGLDSRD